MQETRLAKQRLLRPGRLQEAEISGVGIGLHQIDRIGQTDEVGGGRVRRLSFGIQFAAPDQRHRGLRIDRRNFARALIVLHYTPGTVFGQHDRAARCARENVVAGVVRGGVDVDAAEAHQLVALADIDDTVDRPADGAELAIQQLREKFSRQRHTARRELNITEHAARRHTSAHGAGRYVIDLDVGIEINRLQIDLFGRRAGGRRL